MSLLDKARELPDQPGVYIMKDAAQNEIYVGKAKSLRRRVSSYFQKRDHTPKEVALIENIADFEYVVTDSEIEAFLLESRLIKDLQPKYNFMLKNNELYPYIEVTMGEDFPRVFTTRQKSNPDSRYFGPYVSAGDLRATLGALQRIFGFRTCKREIRADDGKRRFQRACLNYHIGRCSGVCADKTPKEDYRRRIVSLCRFLSGQKKDLIADLEKEMETEAAAYRFENAARLRDLVGALQHIHESADLDESLSPLAPSLDPQKSLLALQEALHLDWTPRRIEGIDIANLQGQETVGSLVYFLDGSPWKDGYRRFRIKTVEGQDDFACVQEVVRRRYGKLRDQGEELPDIVLIDGGKGQLHAAEDAFREIGVTVPVLMSLAKAEEIPYRAGQSDPVPMTRRNAGLKLLMHIRDEAHRFAQHYHHILRRKAMFGEDEAK